MSAIPPLPHSLIWKHFHGQRVRNHLEPLRWLTMTYVRSSASFLESLLRAGVCVRARPRVSVYIYTRCSGLRAFKPTIRP